MSKKILSLVLAVVMLFSICAVAASAELASGQVGLRLETNATVGTPADTEVWVKLYIDVPEAMNFAYNNLTIAWNSEAYTPNSSNQTKVNDAIVMGDSYVDTMKGTSAATHTTTGGANAIKNLTAEEQSYGWNKAVQLQLAGPGGSYTSTTGFPVEPGYSEVLTMYFTTNREITASDVIGFPMSAYNTTQLKLQTMERNNTSSKQLVAIDNLVVTQAVPAAAAATPDVYKLAETQKHQMSDGSYRTCSYFAFDAATINPDFVVSEDPELNGHSNYITGITATVTLNGDPVDASKIPVIRFVYNLGSGKYGFRVILNGAEADDVITITPVTSTKDSATFTAETITFTVADVAAV